MNPDTHALSIQHGVPQLFKPYTAAELRRVIHQGLAGWLRRTIGGETLRL